MKPATMELISSRSGDETHFDETIQEVPCLTENPPKAVSEEGKKMNSQRNTTSDGNIGRNSARKLQSLSKQPSNEQASSCGVVYAKVKINKPNINASPSGLEVAESKY